MPSLSYQEIYQTAADCVWKLQLKQVMGLIFLWSSVLNLHLESSRACVTVTGRHRAAPTQTCSCLFPEAGGRKIQMRGIPDLTDPECRCEEVFSCWVSFPGAGSADGEMIEEAMLAAVVQGESQSSDEAGWGGARLPPPLLRLELRLHFVSDTKPQRSH